eukprot:GDKJ01056989.1.p1 GENE.GDKJ01056989.1~~GDKJ01056989.1.p1  ORF type:complete len:267 (-),score=54.79 GDKJ01056989.1:65-865(-)
MDRSDFVHLAKAAEQAERFDDMKKFMLKIVPLLTKNSPFFTSEERTLLCVSIRETTKILREQCKKCRLMINSYSIDKTSKSAIALTFCKKQMDELKAALKVTCEEMLSLIDNQFGPTSDDSILEISFLKLKGDYWRYISEVVDGVEFKTACDKARAAYIQATQNAKILSPCHPQRLSVLINYSMFLYDSGEVEEALNEAQHSYANGLKSVESVLSLPQNATGEIIYSNTLHNSFSPKNTDEVEDAVQLLQTLKKNISMWSQELAEA